MPRTVSEQLGAALRKIDRPGMFCVGGSLNAVNPGLDVGGVGLIGLPLTPRQADDLKGQCRDAPYGNGVQTLVDHSVRRVWQLDPDRFAITNPDWAAFLRGVVESVQAQLGLEKQKLEHHLYNLLLYEPGSFFRPHRDGEKLDRMVATLVVVLPSAFRGGELVVRHEGEQRVIDFGNGADPLHTHYAAFYADCEHEVHPLTAGYRLCLVYNLTLAKARKPLTAPTSGGHIEAVAGILRGWSTDDPRHKLVVPLDHQYTQDGLAWDALKGVDRVKADVLSQAAARAGCRASLALLTFWESGAAEEQYRPRGRYSRWGDDDEPDSYTMVEVYDTTLTAEHWSAADGTRPAFGPMQVAPEEVVPPEALTRVTPEENCSGYTGNEGMTLERWYRHAVIVLWPNARQFDVLCDCGIAASIAALRERIGVGGKKAADGETREAGLAFARTVLTRSAGSHLNQPEAEELGEALLALGDPELAREFLRRAAPANDQLKLGRLVRAMGERFGWETFRPEVVSLFSAPVVDRSTQEAGPNVGAFERNLELLESLCLTKAKRKADEAERVRLGVALSEAFEAYLGSLDEKAVTSSDWRFQNVDRAKLLAGLTRSLLATGQCGRLTGLLDRLWGNTKLYPFSAHVTALTALRPWLRTHLTSACDGVARWVSRCRAELDTRTASEPTPPTDFRRDADVPCECADCAELRAFLLNPTEAAHRFRAGQDRRSHLEHAIRQHGCDLSCATEKRGSPHTLVCTKTVASFQARLKKYHADVEHLATVHAIAAALPV